jgi:uncharacterized protein YbaR (Trm112 family)
MGLDQQLLDILVCPQCKGELALIEGGVNLLCNRCQLKFPVRDDIPFMLVEEALDLKQRQQQKAGVPAAQRMPKVNFRVAVGVDEGMSFQLEQGTCRAIGRASQDPQKTTVFNVDFALSLDESTKGLILQYVSKQFRKTTTSLEAMASQEQLGQFRRSPDVVLSDGSLSRLHAMIFYDVAGVGILDLVSKNGTFVNGEEVESRLLQRGDAIELGETKIVFEG